MSDRTEGERAGRLAAYQTPMLGLMARISLVAECAERDPSAVAYAVGFIAGVADVFDAMADADVATDVRPPRDGALS